jgi:exodeoxyribonuclease VII small subunit
MATKKPVPGDAPSAEPSFEERLAALEAVVLELEGEDLSLEASIKRYQDGVEHLRACRALLDRAEQRLVELVQDPQAEGGAVERALSVGERGLEPDAGPGR